MIYKTRPGIVLLRICDANILAATRPLWDSCPAIRPVPRMWAGCWSLMEKGRNSEEVIDAFVDMFRQPKEQIREKLSKIFEELYKEGFLIAEDETI